MKAWLARQWAATWRMVSGVSLRLKIVGIALLMAALLSLGLIWGVRATIMHVLTSELSWQGILLGGILGRVTQQIVVTTLLVTVVGLAISAGLTLLLTRPVLALAEALQRVAEGDLSQRVTPWADDELGHAQESFNVMVERLAQSRQEMEAANRRLVRTNRELSALYAISRAVTAPLELAEVLQRALYQAIELVQASGGWVCLLGEEDSCQICVASGAPEEANIGIDYCQKCLACRDAARARQALVTTPLPPRCPLRTVEGVASHAIVPLLVKGRTVGLLNLVCEADSGLSVDDLHLLTDLGRQLGVAIENARLWEELKRKEELRGQLLGKIIGAQEQERQRISRELHDEAGQALTSLLVGLRALERASSPEQLHALVSNLREVVTQTLDNVHHLAVELRPSVLDDLGLVPALSRYVQSCRERFGFQADLVTTGMDNQRLPPEVETTLYRIVQEALTNVARHAHASHAGVVLQRREGTVVLTVDDDGVGFDMAEAASSRQTRERLGLYGMEERASLLGGWLGIESKPGAGTSVRVEIPLEVTWSSSGETTSREAPPLSES